MKAIVLKPSSFFGSSFCIHVVLEYTCIAWDVPFLKFYEIIISLKISKKEIAPSFVKMRRNRVKQWAEQSL